MKAEPLNSRLYIIDLQINLRFDRRRGLQYSIAKCSFLKFQALPVIIVLHSSLHRNLSR